MCSVLKFESFKEMNVEIKLPGGVHSFEYVKNSHYVKLTDDDGNTTKLDARGLMQYTCNACKEPFWMKSNLATHCPICKDTNITQDWVELQLSFIPERSSKFVSPPQKHEEPEK